MKNKKQYAMFVGRWQPLHDGHLWLFNQALKENKNILICIRDVEPDDKNPWTAHEVLENIENHYSDLILDGTVKVMIIPDIESINYGRGVGYKIIEHVPPADIHDISATAIRESMKSRGLL
jgi:cytidyltransferase-like protein